MEFQFLYWIRSSLGSPGLDEFMTAITFLGYGGGFGLLWGQFFSSSEKPEEDRGSST